MANNMNILMIGETYVKERSTVMENVEAKFIKTNILLAQDIHVQQILGSSLYNDIISESEDWKTAYDAGITGVTKADYISAKYITLLDDYIEPSLLYYTLYESMFSLYSKITNKGVVTQSSDASNVVSEEYMHKMKDDFLNKAEYYAQRLTNYLIDNTTIYTEYLDTDGDVSDIAPEMDPYLNNGWYLKPTNRTDCYPWNTSRMRDL